MIHNCFIHLEDSDEIVCVEKINNFGTLQLDVIFKSGKSILIDEAILDELDKYRNKKGVLKNEN